jgi:hypothetical protein
MKKNLFTIMFSMLFSAAALGNGPVNEQVLKVFSESFKSATQVTWYELSDGYTVNFLQDDIRYNITYSSKGEFISSRRYYFSDKLPMYILFKVKRKFPGKSIYGVTETTDENGVEYYITLQNDKSWWMVKVTTRDFMEITEKLLKNQ